MRIEKAGRRIAPFALSTAAAALLAAAHLTPSITNVTAELGAGRVSIGAVRPGVSLIGAAFAQTLDSVVVEDVRASWEGQSLRVPRMEITGLNMSRADLLALFNAGATEPLPTRLARISAARVSAPEVVWEQALGPGRSASTYRNVLAAEIKEGRIARMTAERATVETSSMSSGTVSGTMGRMAMEDVDGPGLAELFLGKAGDPSGPLRRLHGLSVAENLSMTDPQGVTVRVARMSMRNLDARPSADGWAGIFRGLAIIQDPNKPTPEEGKRAFRLLADMFGSVDVGPLSVNGIEISDDVGVKIDRIVYEGAAGGHVADARMEGFEFAGKDARGRIGLVSISGFSFAPTFAGMEALLEAPAGQPDPGALRKLLPTIGAIRLSGLDFDVPPTVAADTPAAEPAKNVRFGVREVELAADQPLNGIPTGLKTAVRNFVLALPADEKADGLRDLVAMGYRNLDLSFATSARYDAVASALDIGEISVQGAGMGNVTLRGTLGNVGKDVFDPDSAIAAVALVGATARSLELVVEDKGLAERLLTREARRVKSTPEEVRREYGMAAAVGVPALLGSSAPAKAVSQALARFVAKPGRLVISLKARNPAGLGVADLAALSDPTSVLEQLEVIARAE